MMNKEQFSGKWHELKGKVKEKWGKLTDDDISQVHGKWEHLAGTLQKKYGWTKEQTERELTSWFSSYGGHDGKKEDKDMFKKGNEKHPEKAQEKHFDKGHEKHLDKGHEKHHDDRKRKAG